MSKITIIVTCMVLGLFEGLCQHTITRLPYPLNTRDYDEICPVFDYNEEIMYFTKVAHHSFQKTLIVDGEDLSESLSGEAYDSKLSQIYTIIAGQQVTDPYTSSYNQDIWYATLEHDRYVLYHPGYPLNDALPNSICSPYGDDGFVVVNQFFEHGGMQEGFSTIQIDDYGNTSFPKPFIIRDFELTSSDVNLSMSEDKQVAILAFAYKNQSHKDLYVSIKFNDTIYAAPVPLNINSLADETTPFLSQDKRLLYFASNREGGEGKMDIYVSERLDYSYKQWSEPRRFNAFLNTTHNESHPYVSRDAKMMYFTSDREGSSDIYSAKLIRDTLHSPIIVKISVTKEGQDKGFPAEISWKNTFDKTDDWPGYRRSRNGYHEITIDSNEPLSIKAVNRNWYSQIVNIDPQELQDKGITQYYVDLTLTADGYVADVTYAKEQEVALSLPLDLKAGSSVILDNIYFARGTASVLPNSFSTLRLLGKKLKENPAIIIRVEGHTDNIGNASDLMDLSIARAAAIKTFLKSEGVADYQVEIAGYGGTQPITDNSDEAHRRRNRRVEIKVLKN